MNAILFPFSDFWWMYLALTGFVLIFLSTDLSLHQTNRVPSMRCAAIWMALWVALALAFCFVLYLFTRAQYSVAAGLRLGMEFLAGYIVEESLSIDNMFVFVLVFRYFNVPHRYQHRVLFYGVLGAMVFRGIFIAAGSALVHLEWVLTAFGVFLIVSGFRLGVSSDTHFAPGESRIVRIVGRFLPVTPTLHGPHFLVRLDGVLHATPLLMVLVFLESTDIMFATDSVPAVFGVTREPFVVYSSNIFAVLGLRAMFFLLSGAIERFHLLKHGLAIVLMFVGLKMVWLDRLFGGRLPISVSLGIITVVIGASIIFSLVYPKSTARSSAHRQIPARVLLQRLTGGLFLLLSAVAVWHAIAPVRAMMPLVTLSGIGAEALYVSAFCYAVCGTVLIWGSGRPYKL